MLSMQMKSGDYVTIGENVVVQVFKESGPQFRISIKAPREVPIVRGKVLERSGNQRPEGLRDRGVRKSPSDLAHAERHKQKQLERKAERSYRAKELAEAMGEMTNALKSLSDGSSSQEQVLALHTQLARIACATDALGITDGARDGIADPDKVNF